MWVRTVNKDTSRNYTLIIIDKHFTNSNHTFDQNWNCCLSWSSTLGLNALMIDLKTGFLFTYKVQLCKIIRWCTNKQNSFSFNLQWNQLTNANIQIVCNISHWFDIQKELLLECTIIARSKTSSLQKVRQPGLEEYWISLQRYRAFSLTQQKTGSISLQGYFATLQVLISCTYCLEYMNVLFWHPVRTFVGTLPDSIARIANKGILRNGKGRCHWKGICWWRWDPLQSMGVFRSQVIFRFRRRFWKEMLSVL